MKIYAIKSLATLSLFSGLVLMGCLKDKEYDDRTIQSNHGDTPKVIEIGLTGTSNKNFYGFSLNSSSVDTTFALLPVNLAAPEPAQEDINVTLTQNDALITAYNTTNGTNYSVPASSLYTITNAGNVVTIPKGSYTGYLMIKFKPSSFLGSDYAIGYTVSKVDKPGYTISGNLQNGVVAIAIKNKFDGKYKVTGTLVDLTAPTITGKYPLNWELRTTSGSANAIYDVDAKAQNHGILSGGSSSSYGSFGLNVTFDPVTNKVTSIVNAFGQPASNGRSAQLDPSGVNAWDPATKNIKIKYYLLQPGTTIRTTFDETWTYVGPR